MRQTDNHEFQDTVWRDEDGNIRCPGDSCPQECEDACPVWFHSMGMSMVQRGLEDEAIRYFKEAIAIAPDFKEAWNNLATTYGKLNNHLEANKAFFTAYSLDNSYEPALWGLILSYMNLGQYKEAMKYCEEYALWFNESDAERLRESILAAQQSEH